MRMRNEGWGFKTSGHIKLGHDPLPSPLFQVESVPSSKIEHIPRPLSVVYRSFGLPVSGQSAAVLWC